MAIIVKSPRQIEFMREAGKITAGARSIARQAITAGITTAEIDKNTWTEEMLDLLMEYIRTEPAAEKYRDLDWSKEYDLARNGDPNDTQSAL